MEKIVAEEKPVEDSGITFAPIPEQQIASMSAQERAGKFQAQLDALCKLWEIGVRANYIPEETEDRKTKEVSIRIKPYIELIDTRVGENGK